MTTELWVLYDSTCPFCAWCRDWLASRPARVRMRFLCCRSSTARDRFGALPLVDELVVLDEHGRWWAGPSAFAMCLWALEGFHDLAWWISSDALWWLARPFFVLLGEHRESLAWLVGVDCSSGACAVPVGPGAYR
ncbi:MAG: DUF393 domain-containing protein [Sandaracinaceae bacterium]|nr:DUF393 domain-containing protein [Sandaracinaceae bacterium]